jgi:hypothetical protein
MAFKITRQIHRECEPGGRSGTGSPGYQDLRWVEIWYGAVSGPEAGDRRGGKMYFPEIKRGEYSRINSGCQEEIHFGEKKIHNIKGAGGPGA